MDANSPALPHRPLLPAIPPQTTSSPSTNPSSTISLPKRRYFTASACEGCRKCKRRCSGTRPQCARCKQSKIECIYETEDATETSGRAAKRKFTELQRRSAAHEDIYGALQTRPERDAYAILSKIRQGDDVETVARHLKFGDVLLQVSVSPETRYRYEFPLLSEMPAHLVNAGNPYLDSLIYEWTIRAPAVAQPFTASTISTSPSGSAPENASHATGAQPTDPYLKPIHAADVVDALLSAVQPSKWTDVLASDNLMRRLLSRYLSLEYGAFCSFRKEYFLEDMAKMRKKHCSALLVNAVLALACFYEPSLPDRAEVWNPESLSFKFLAEARRLWDLEQDVDKLTTIQAAVIMNVIYNLCGVDQIGWTYTQKAIEIAKRLGIFQDSPGTKSSKTRDASNFTAWSLFYWAGIISFSFHKPPAVPKPPVAPLPDPAESPQWYGELWLKYPHSDKLYPASFGHLFREGCRFVEIMNEAADCLFGSPPRTTAADFATLYYRFRDWYKNLPGVLLPRNIVLPAQIRIHLWYYQTLIRIFNNSVILHPNRTPEEDIELRTAFGGVHPQEILDHAKLCLETVLRIYYVRHGFEIFDAAALGFFMMQGFLSIESLAGKPPQSPDYRARKSTLVMVAKCLYDQGKSTLIGRVLYEILRNQMPSDAIDDLGRFAGTEVTWRTHLRPAEIRSEYPVTPSAADPSTMGTMMQVFREAAPVDSSDEACTP